MSNSNDLLVTAVKHPIDHKFEFLSISTIPRLPHVGEYSYYVDTGYGFHFASW